MVVSALSSAGRFFADRSRCLAQALSATALAATSPVLAQGGPPDVIVERVEVTQFVDAIEAIGTLRASETVQISANVTETVSRIGFDDGQAVRRGQMLVEFVSREEGARISEAQAAVSIARQEYDRAKALFDSDALSQSALLTRERDLAFAQAQLESATAQGSDRVIRAPFDGVVGLRSISVGATVRPGDAIVRIDDISEMNLDFAVPATRLSALATGQTVTARAAALPGEVFTGTVSAIDSFIDPSTRSVLVRAVLANPEGALRPGLLMTVSLQSSPRQSLTVSESALIPFGRQMSVLVAVPDADTGLATIVQRPVDIGARRAGEAEIVSGLEAGDLVVTHGTLKARPGQSVRPTLANRSDGSVLAQFLSASEG